MTQFICIICKTLYEIDKGENYNKNMKNHICCNCNDMLNESKYQKINYKNTWSYRHRVWCKKNIDQFFERRKEEIEK